MNFELLSLGVKLQVATWKQQKLDHFSGVLSIFIEQIVFIIMIISIGGITKDVAGWNLNELLIIYGFNRICLSIVDTIGENLWVTSELAREGDLMIYKSLPGNQLFLLMLNKIHFERLLGGLLAIIIIACAAYKLKLNFTLWSALIVLPILIIGSINMLSVMIIGSSLSIKYIGSDPISFVWNVTEFSKYPSSIFGRAGRFILSYVLPLSLTGYVPALVLLGKLTTKEYPTICLMFLISCIIFYTANVMWRNALRDYEGVGG